MLFRSRSSATIKMTSFFPFQLAAGMCLLSGQQRDLGLRPVDARQVRVAPDDGQHGREEDEQQEEVDACISSTSAFEHLNTDSKDG